MQPPPLREADWRRNAACGRRDQPQPHRGERSWSGMSGESSRRELLLAVALGSSRKHSGERRLLPDRRSGIDRRSARLEVSEERRSGIERRQRVRRKTDEVEGATLLQKALKRMSGRPRAPARP